MFFCFFIFIVFNSLYFLQSNCFLRNGTNSNNCWRHVLRESIWFFLLLTFLNHTYDETNDKTIARQFLYLEWKGLWQNVINIFCIMWTIKYLNWTIFQSKFRLWKEWSTTMDLFGSKLFLMVWLSKMVIKRVCMTNNNTPLCFRPLICIVAEN